LFNTRGGVTEQMPDKTIKDGAWITFWWLKKLKIKFQDQLFCQKQNTATIAQYF
jgi:hypothetical protein